MKEIPGRLKIESKLRSPLGRVEKKQRPIQPCRLYSALPSAVPSCAGRPSGAAVGGSQ